MKPVSLKTLYHNRMDCSSLFQISYFRKARLPSCVSQMATLNWCDMRQGSRILTCFKDIHAEFASETHYEATGFPKST